MIPSPSAKKKNFHRLILLVHATVEYSVWCIAGMGLAVVFSTVACSKVEKNESSN